MKPRKVLHVLNSSSGGSAMSALGLMASLEAHGISSCAVCHAVGTASERQRLVDAVRGEVVFTPLYWWNVKTRLRYWQRPLAELRQGVRTVFARRSARAVRKAAERWGADLLHTNTILTPEGGMAAVRLGLPHVWHVRELVGPGKPFRFRKEGAAFAEVMAARASKVIANSHVTAEQLRGWLPDGLLEIVPNGIDVSRFVPRERAGGRLVVAMVGQLTSRWKKHGVFVDAALRVDPSLPIEFRIYGHDPSDGGTKPAPYVDELHARIRAAGASARFGWPGYVTDPARIMDEVDLLVHPADHESFGRVIVEAMAAGLPVIGVGAGGVAEIVRDGVTGVLVPPDDPVAMARAIEALARDPRRRAALGAAGRARAIDTYSLEACAAGVVRVYEAAMARPLGRGR